MFDVPLIDDIEEDPVNDNILEENSTEFEGFDGEYGPYFPNFTSATFITKFLSGAVSILNGDDFHPGMLCLATSAYEDLAKIITHPKFRKEDVIGNIRRMRKWRYRLPLLTVRQHDVPICSQKAPSALASSKKAFTISPLTYLERILNNPAITPKLYFGPGVIKNEKSEFWHGNLWQESPLFGSHDIRSNSG
ncbi:9414_t:CDS:2, partial [Dentiscutata heterogama]